jgi:hypothetical protein
MPNLQIEDIFKHKDEKKRKLSPVTVNKSEKLMTDEARLAALKDIRVPRFLINKWLNIEIPKSKFIKESCRIDNADDVSEYSESSC